MCTKFRAGLLKRTRLLPRQAKPPVWLQPAHTRLARPEQPHDFRWEYKRPRHKTQGLESESTSPAAAEDTGRSFATCTRAGGSRLAPHSNSFVAELNRQHNGFASTNEPDLALKSVHTCGCTDVFEEKKMQ